jgi:C1A family cysteine protease
MLGRPVSFGIEIGNRFEPDGQGIIPDQSGRGGGHCMCAVGLKQIGSRWYLKVQNSWSTQWGLAGYCFMPESYFQGGDNWAVITNADDPLDPNVPPVVKP